MKSSETKHEQKMSKNHPQDIPNDFIEEQTKKVPNLIFMIGAGICLASVAILSRHREETSPLVLAALVPSILILGLYNKVVKVENELLH